MNLSRSIFVLVGFLSLPVLRGGKEPEGTGIKRRTYSPSLPSPTPPISPLKSLRLRPPFVHRVIFRITALFKPPFKICEELYILYTEMITLLGNSTRLQESCNRTKCFFLRRFSVSISFFALTHLCWCIGIWRPETK